MKTIKSTRSGVTIGDGSTEVTEIPESRNEPDVPNECGRQIDDESQKWGWIHHCDQVISNLPIGLA